MPLVSCGIGVKPVHSDFGPSEGIAVGVEGPGELGLGGVVGEGGVEMDGDMCQVRRTGDDELKMALDVSADGITNDAHEVYGERSWISNRRYV